MLMLSRKIGERIYIGENVRITVSRFKGENKVVIGVECPDDVKVMREEIMGYVPQYFIDRDAKRHASKV